MSKFDWHIPTFFLIRFKEYLSITLILNEADYNTEDLGKNAIVA